MGARGAKAPTRTAALVVTILILSRLCPPTPALSVGPSAPQFPPATPPPPPTPRACSPLPTAEAVTAESSRSVAARVRELCRHPAAARCRTSARDKLARRHLPTFSSPTSLFDRFASAVCDAGVVARKEVFETWSAALLIDDHFRSSRRVADVAAGHGLLAWALLLLDDDREERRRQGGGGGPGAGGGSLRPRTALCVDRRMPPAAAAVESAMLGRFPRLGDDGRFSYVEGSLEQVLPHPSCLLASVHACAGLSDLLVSVAAENAAPVAVVPCCHSRKKLDGLASDFAREEYDAIVAAERVPDLADRLDGARIAALRNAGFDVRTGVLPEAFTAKNRLIMASPAAGDGGPRRRPLARRGRRERPDIAAGARWRRPGRMAPLPTGTARARFLAEMTVPCEDAPGPRAAVSALSGRAAAERRRRALHARNHAINPQLDLSAWLPDDDTDERLTGAALSSLGSGIDDGVRCSAVQLGPAFVNSAGRRSMTFRLTYSSSGDSSGEGWDALPGDRARAVHEELYRRIPVAFPGCKCR